MQHRACPRARTDGLPQRAEQEGRVADRICEGGTVELDTLAGIDAALALQRLMVAVFGN